jgi:hypothetical protein
MEVGNRLRKEWRGEELGDTRLIKNTTTNKLYIVELIEIYKNEAVWKVIEEVIIKTSF